MYITNRINAYKIVRAYKTTGQIKVLNQYGATFKINSSDIEPNGYRFVKSKPKVFG